MRFVWNALVAIFATAVTNVTCLLTWMIAPDGRYGTLCTRYWGRAILWGSGIKTPVDGGENARGGPFIVVANHSSMLDICVAAATVPLRFHFVSRPFFFKIPVLGWAMLLARHISLDPRKPRAAARVLKTLAKQFAMGTSVLFFPEGTRSQDGTIHRYRRGPFRAAIENGVPILPVHFDRVHERLRKGSFRLRPGVVRVIIGEPIPTADMKAGDGRELAARVEEWTRCCADRTGA